MLDHLRQRAVEALSSVHSVTLSTYGAAELQASSLPCEAVGLHLYLLLPIPSDHLLNLENHADVVVTTPLWQLRGTAVVLEAAACLPRLNLCHKPEAQWSRLVEIRPSQLNLRHPTKGGLIGWGFSETIDIDT
ncbi:MAG: hypothetical protein KDE51_22195 [Anaerolineales bacterium]|nr:hypothetical protein [Anaerolineales bacterium]